MIKKHISSTHDAITAQCVVIGCSNHNLGCTHENHASEKNFFSIDISADIHPDLCMDITNDALPDTLKNKFLLTFVEFLPYWAYNLDELTKKYLHIDGGIGWQNILELTHQDGFILVIGSVRSFCFRRSLENVHYIEFYHKDTDTYSLLVPKNQALSYSEVLCKIKQLPQEILSILQNVLEEKIEILTKDNSDNTVDFCKFNYTPSDKNISLIRELNLYRTKRGCEHEYRSQVSFFGKKFNLGFPSYKKIEAVDTLILVLLGNLPQSSLETHKSVLSNGRLGKIIDSHLKNRPLEDYFTSLDGKISSCESKINFLSTLNETKQENSNSLNFDQSIQAKALQAFRS